MQQTIKIKINQKTGKKNRKIKNKNNKKQKTEKIKTNEKTKNTYLKQKTKKIKTKTKKQILKSSFEKTLKEHERKNVFWNEKSLFGMKLHYLEWNWNISS